MAGGVSEEAGVGKAVDSSGQCCQFGEALAEWRSSEQVENGTPSTSPPFWDSDDDDNGGPKPSQLYGRNTWKIENFSQTNKRELRSDVFEVGGYKWYILIYPQGCDVCNHLSLFLCVANHDKLLPGWSHFAQFTIAVVNKDPKKSKYSDTLHRFWKKEHDWGWKKFMELSKMSDGFLDASDTLIIKAQVQVIREKADRPFRCLDCQYRRELVRVYLTNVEQICRRFVEERRGKLGRLIENKNKWSSFCAFWLGKDQNTRRDMSREKMDAILKLVVKHFFIEKEVTSTLVMDSLYSGLKALEGQSKSKKGRVKLADAEEMLGPIIHVEKDMFVLGDDVLILLERAAMEPLPPKDDKGPQNRMKDGNSGEDFNKDSIERDERRLTELGRRTVEIFVLAHIFNHKIEVAYDEAVAFKMQEELIREEHEQKAKRGASEKEKKSKKKQTKQKRNNRKGKDKVREELVGVVTPENHQDVQAINDKKDIIVDEQSVTEKPDIHENASDATDSAEGMIEAVQPDSEDRDASPVNWDTDTLEVHPLTQASSGGVTGLLSVPNGTSEKRSSTAMDDSSSTCSTDSVPSYGPSKGDSYLNCHHENFPSRGKNHRGKTASDMRCTIVNTQTSEFASDAGDINDMNGRSEALEGKFEVVVNALQERVTRLEHHVEQMKDEDVSLQKKVRRKDQSDVGETSEEKTVVAAPSFHKSPPKSPPKSLNSAVPLKPENNSSDTVDSVQLKKASSNLPQQADKAVTSIISLNAGMSKPESQSARMDKKPLPVMSRSPTASLEPSPRPTVPVVSMVQTNSLLARSTTAAGQMGPDPQAATLSYPPQSYRNAIVGNSAVSSASRFAYSSSPTVATNLSPINLNSPNLVTSPLFSTPSSERVDLNSVQSGYAFNLGSQDVLQNGHHWMENSQRDASRSTHAVSSSVINAIQNLELYRRRHTGIPEHFSSEFAAVTSGRQSQFGAAEEFPHLDIINDLLDDENGVGISAAAGPPFESRSNGLHLLNRQFSFPCDVGVSSDLPSSSGRLERMRSYHDGFQQAYVSSATQFDSGRDFIPQSSPLPYASGHMDGLIQSQWNMSSPDLSFTGLRNVDEGSQYYPEYSNPASGINRYTVPRSPNGQ